MIDTTDNNRSGYVVDEKHLENCRTLAGKTIKEWREDTQCLFVFSDQRDNEDRIGCEYVFSMNENKIFTGNVMGFIGLNGSEIKIRSRFDKGESDYFLHYMLQRVFKFNVLEFEHHIERNSIFDFLLYLFPVYMKKALRQGVFKEYQSREYNNANVRGIVDMGCHIKMNYPFAGKIAYKTREFSYDNRITQLIRHTIEEIKQHSIGIYILSCDTDMHDCVEQIMAATPLYSKHKRHDVIVKNIKPVLHPYFHEYRTLQKLCLQILNREGLSYGNDPDKVYGLLFDGAWLWEEYINTLVSRHDFIHSENKTGKNPIYLFRENKYKRFPDFHRSDFILDAKYKRIMERSDENISESVHIHRDDMHQLISYMYILGAKNGGFVHPADEEHGVDVEKEKDSPIGNLNGHGGAIYSWAIQIPQNCSDFKTFCFEMKAREMAFENKLPNCTF